MCFVRSFYVTLVCSYVQLACFCVMLCYVTLLLGYVRVLFRFLAIIITLSLPSLYTVVFAILYIYFLRHLSRAHLRTYSDVAIIFFWLLRSHNLTNCLIVSEINCHCFHELEH